MTIGPCSETQTVDTASLDSPSSLLEDDLPAPRLWASGSQAVHLPFVSLINTVLANLVVLWGS